MLDKLNKKHQILTWITGILFFISLIMSVISLASSINLLYITIPISVLTLFSVILYCRSINKIRRIQEIPSVAGQATLHCVESTMQELEQLRK